MLSYFTECREYYSLTKKGGGTIESGNCRMETAEKGYDRNRLTIVGGIAAEESEFPHMVSNIIFSSV